MGLIRLDPEKTNSEYARLYDQTGGGMMPVFQGARVQRGFGLGNIFASLFRNTVVPLLTKGAISLGKTAMQTGVNVIQDGMRGQNVGESLKRNVKKAGLGVVDRAMNRVNTPTKKSRRSGGYKKKPPQGKRSRNRPAVKRKRPNKSLGGDIFG